MNTTLNLLLVKDLMKSDFFTIFDNENINTAAKIMAENNIGVIPVINKTNNHLVGIITDRDIVKNCIATDKSPQKTKVSECMTNNPIKIVADATTQDAVKLMSSFGTRRLPVVENEKLIGIISISDIAKFHSSCSNEKYPNENCILIDIAKELEKTVD